MTINLNELFQKVKSLKASNFPIRELIPISEDTPLYEVINQLVITELPILPVIDKNNHYIGIITFRDLLFLFQRKHTSLHEAFSLQHMKEGYVAGELININLPVIFDDDSLERITESMYKFQTTVLLRASNRKEQIKGLIYMKDLFIEIRTILRKMVVEQEDSCK